ncbi:MAG: hypothetical protein U9R25_09415 [Chloroflexota bacterium]|nr:hypothetical protein [Chloroflexota bacterium]
MRIVLRILALGLLLPALLLLAGCSSTPEVEPTLVPPTSAPVETPEADTPTPVPPKPTKESTATPTSTPSAVPLADSDLEIGMETAHDFLTGLAGGEFRGVYGSLLTTSGKEKLADLVLGRLALANPHISFFEVLGAEPTADRQVAVNVLWQETYEGQGIVGAQPATIFLARENDTFLVEDIELGEYLPEATPVPPALPRAEALVNPAIPGSEMRFRASGFEGGETVLTWLELPEGGLLEPGFATADPQGGFERAYQGEATTGVSAGRMIWWAQALRDSSRNTGITFDVAPAPTATATPTRAPTRARPKPTALPRATATPAPPSTAYSAPVSLWPEQETSREEGSALIVEFVPPVGQLAPEDFYELVLVARDPLGNVYNAGSVRGKGDACHGQYSQPCLSLTAYERFMKLFHRDGFEGQGTWFVQVVRQTGPDQFETVSPPSEPRLVILKTP